MSESASLSNSSSGGWRTAGTSAMPALRGVTQRARKGRAVEAPLREEILGPLLKRLDCQRLAFGVRQDHRRHVRRGRCRCMNDRAAPRLVRPDIQEQDVGALSGKALGSGFDAKNMCDAELFGSIGFEH